MKKGLWGSLILGILLVQSVFAIDLIGGEQKLTATLQEKINKCESNGGTIDTNFKIVNGQTVTTYFCYFDEDNVCDLDSYYSGQCYFNFKDNQEQDEEKEIDYGKYKSLVLEYRKLLYEMPDFSFVGIINWGKGIYAEQNLAKALYSLDVIDLRLELLSETKSKFKEAFKAIEKENSRIRDNLAKQYIRDNISELSPEDAVLGGTMRVINIKKLDKLFYEVDAEDGHIAVNFKIKFNALKAENLDILLNIETTVKEDNLDV